MGIGWDTFKDPFKGIPVVGGALEAVYDSLPVDNVIRMGEEIGKGNWGSALGNLGIAGLETAAMFIPGSSALASSGAKATSKLGAKAIARGILRPGTAGLGKWAGRTATVVGPSLANIGVNAAGNYLWNKPSKASAASVAGASAADMRRFEEANKPAEPAPSAAAFRKAEEESMRQFREIQRKKRLTSGSGTRPGAAGGATVAGKAPQTPSGGLDSILGALTPEQLEQVAGKRRELQSQYDLLNAAFTKQTAEGKAAQEQADMLARNIGAGETQNLATNLAAIGMDLSPGAAIVGQEGISNTQAQQQAQARRTLADLLAEIESGRAKQQSEYLTGLTELEKIKQLMRIQNTMEQQRAAYDQLGSAG